MIRALVTIGALGFVMLLGACGYSTARLEALSGGRTIAVRAFENRTFRRDLEMRLTGQILTELRARTSFGIATPDRADYVIDGWVDASEEVSLARVDRTVVLGQYRGTAHVVVTDRRSGRVVRTYDVRAATSYTPETGGETLLGSATNELTRRLAIRIVQGLEPGL
jgi:hypothetical protein